ncbi:DUF6194 family protein [Streptomyces sp. NPDC029526]|uniref:DUF6194 family protein n=1 Tax=Streptomyces sp. NPDC029526 TaxID=3155728 RepID=UPI0033C1265D
MEQIITAVRGFEGSHVLVPAPGDGSPEAAWGDAFFFYAPDGRPSPTAQPYGTVVTRDQPGDTASGLDRPGRWRVNCRVAKAEFRRLTGEEPRSLVLPRDFTAPDLVLPHPVYGALGWVAVVDPGERTLDTVLRLLRDAHHAARARYERRRTR